MSDAAGVRLAALDRPGVNGAPSPAVRTAGQALPRVLARNRMATAALLVMIAAVLAATLAPYLPLVDPDRVDTPHRLQPPLVAGHLLGTDEFGRDMLSRVIWGGRVSLLAGAGTAALAMVVGVGLGILGGYYTGWVEGLIMRLTDVLMAFPYILLAIAIVAGLGPGLRNAMIAIAIVGFPLYTRLARSIVLSVRAREFVEAARALGSPDRLILARHILPHLLSPVIVAFSLDVGAKILATAGLSFLGLGTQPPTADWGSMLATGRQFVILRPHVALLPGLAIFVVVLAVNLVGDALRDLLDPRTRTA